MFPAPLSSYGMLRNFSAFKVLYFGLLAGALLLWPERNDHLFHSRRQLWRSDETLTFQSHFVSWDAEHYLFLSENGYKAGAPQCAFYPLYPLLIRWTSSSEQNSDVLAGLVLSNGLSAIALSLLYHMSKRYFGERIAILTLALLAVFPGSLFFQFIYTESLFLFLTMLFWLGLDRRKPALVAIAGFLLPLTRAVGIFCVFPLAYAFWFGARIDCRFESPSESSGASKMEAGSWGVGGALVVPNWSLQTKVLLSLIPFLGWGVYFFLMWWWTGNSLEGFAAQRRFGVESVRNLFHPVVFVVKFFNPTDWHEFKSSVLDRASFVLLLYTLPVIWKLDRRWFIWAFFLGVVPAVSGGFTSYTRFLSVVFPFFIALAVFLSNPRWRWLKWLTLTVFAILHVILVWRFVNYRWAG